MKCSDIQNNLLFFSEGNLQTDDMSNIQLHISTCKNCNDLYSKLQNNLSIIALQKEMTVKPFLFTRIQAKLEKEDSPLPVFYKRVLQPIIVSFIIIFAVFGGMQIGKIYPSSADSATLSSSGYYWNDINQEPIEVALLNE